MTFNGINFDERALAEFCRKNGIARLSLFGSILTDRFGPESDVDFLVEFLPDQRISLFDIGGMIADLSDMLGRQADLRTTQDLSVYFRDDVLRKAKPLYAAKGDFVWEVLARDLQPLIDVLTPVLSEPA